ncbi:membrane associated rhomboid family serine protease [Rhodovulum iodosum]|uniref:Membrane associated rhomboid family serine protease n=1 Tax=Rhodovulum iodosum TaxID=68291 RepID=A0ABV3XSG3_9RHOB|nr:rhomboid family intramembrane serine protease [Rhodovulum robiginosum]RSK30594.1 rhomboid family intramembrane serine protease [Rhodovulum robiginosum]
MQPDPNASALNPLPPVVWALALPIIAMEVVLGAGAAGLVGGPSAVGWRLEAIERFGFSGPVLEWMIARGTWPPEHVLRFVSYLFVHASFTHAIFVTVFLLALGKMVGEIFRAWAVLLLFFASGVAGALAYGLLLDDAMPLIGGFPAVYGLIGAYTFVMWVRLGALGESQYRAFTLIGVLMGLQLVFGLFFGAGNDWLADLTGFCTGFVLSFVVSPGGWQRVLARLRQR